jgi:hypothetical protein
LGQPVELPVKVTVVPAAALVLVGERPAVEHGGGLVRM